MLPVQSSTLVVTNQQKQELRELAASKLATSKLADLAYGVNATITVCGSIASFLTGVSSWELSKKNAFSSAISDIDIETVNNIRNSVPVFLIITSVCGIAAILFNEMRKNNEAEAKLLSNILDQTPTVIEA